MQPERIWQDVVIEAARARALHKPFPTGAERALVVLVEEVGEVAKAIQRGKWGQMEREIVEVAAVCLQWLEQVRADQK